MLIHGEEEMKNGAFTTETKSLRTDKRKDVAGYPEREPAERVHGHGNDRGDILKKEKHTKEKHMARIL